MLIIQKRDSITLLCAARTRHLPVKPGQFLAILVPGLASPLARKRQNAPLRARRSYNGHDLLETVSGKGPSGKSWIIITFQLYILGFSEL